MYRFHDRKVDTNLFLQLQDLSTVIVGEPEIEFEFSFGSYIDVFHKKVTASRVWDTAGNLYRKPGFKSDVFLRTVGTFKHSNILVMKEFIESIHDVSIPKFARQLFTLLEDIRLEEIIKKERPGTMETFALRRKYFKHKFETELVAHATRGLALDELFSLIYLHIQADGPDPYFPRVNEKQLSELENIKTFIYSVYEAKSTDDIVRIAKQIVFRLNQHYEEDSIYEYFIFPVKHINETSEDTLFDELTRTDDVNNCDYQELDEDNNKFIDQRFSSWHRENKNSNQKQTFLKFELDVGTKTNIMGAGARETEDGDQAMGTIQGASGKSEKNDYSDLESLDKQESNQQESSEGAFGSENKHAVKLIKEANTPSKEDILLFQQYREEIEPLERKLSNTLKKTMEHKKNAPQRDLLVGRLSKKLLPAVIDENPRIFYKKNQESKEFDAVFTLLVDCSASMQGKMEETKKGIILFHQVLNQFQIPHAIVGFWEDAMEVETEYQPNYFHTIHSFSDSPYNKTTGAKIMQLEPQEDNRDGFSIRVITRDLAARGEKDKFLLVFSDGEPAAANYDQNGIIDTKEAVSEARKKGIEVIGMFLSDGEISEMDRQTMQNIYGKEHLMVPSVRDLPEVFAPLLKRLLLKSL